ncbi:MAG: hypothetical protein HYY04_10060 [Chloroflexi bacterium]|nr:hypothetical protein [Chloroflexota bacterium]
MNDRERYRATMRFQPVDRPPLHAGHGWAATLARWRQEGLPLVMSVADYFGYDRFELAPVDFRFVPPFPKTILSQDDFAVTYQNDEGVILQDRRDNWELSMPHFLEFPVKNREDFERLKPRMDPTSLERLPPGWSTLCERWRYRTVPLQLMGDRVGGFYGPLRGMMGIEALSYTYYDDPRLIEEMMDAKLHLVLGVIKRVLADTTVDRFVFWEDMACRNGPLISPATFRRLMVPRYRVIADCLRSHGAQEVWVDSDGDVNSLIPLWLEAGVNGVYPMEVQSGMDVVQLRQTYGRDLLMSGGLDKKVLTRDKQAIRDEVMRKVPKLVEEGGYIPAIDHSVPPDVSFEAFSYYVGLLKEIFGMG